MKFCSYTNFDALSQSVVIDFPFLRLNQYLRSLNLSIAFQVERMLPLT